MTVQPHVAEAYATDLEVTIRWSPDGASSLGAHVRVAGVLCANTALTMRAIIDELLRARADLVELELSGLQLCTSDGVECWIELVEGLARNGGELRLVGPRPVVARVLEICAPHELTRCLVDRPAAGLANA